jgi:hypothetical protein
MVTVLLVGIVTFILIYVSVRLTGIFLVAVIQALMLLGWILKGTILLGTRIGLYWKRRAHIRKMGLCAVETELSRKSRKPREVALVERDGVYVPSDGEW